MVKPMKIKIATVQRPARPEKRDPSETANTARTIISTQKAAIWRSVSAATARKRLPMPARGNSSDVCSGVSMVSLSAEDIGDLHELASEAASVLGANRRAPRALRPERYPRPDSCRAARVGAIISPDGFGPCDDPRRCFQPEPGP